MTLIIVAFRAPSPPPPQSYIPSTAAVIPYDPKLQLRLAADASAYAWTWSAHIT